MKFIHQGVNIWAPDIDPWEGRKLVATNWQPQTIMVSSWMLAQLRVHLLSKQEGWDRRRVKRESRKGDQSVYHKSRA